MKKRRWPYLTLVAGLILFVAVLSPTSIVFAQDDDDDKERGDHKVVVGGLRAGTVVEAYIDGQPFIAGDRPAGTRGPARCLVGGRERGALHPPQSDVQHLRLVPGDRVHASGDPDARNTLARYRDPPQLQQPDAVRTGCVPESGPGLAPVAQPLPVTGCHLSEPGGARAGVAAGDRADGSWRSASGVPQPAVVTRRRPHPGAGFAGSRRTSLPECTSFNPASLWARLRSSTA